MSAPILEFRSGIFRRRVRLDGIGRMTVGSGSDADFIVRGGRMRPRHFEIYRVEHPAGDRFYVFDQGSLDGLSVNGQAVRNVRLASGDEIVTAGIRFTFRHGCEPIVIIPDAA